MTAPDISDADRPTPWHGRPLAAGQHAMRFDKDSDRTDLAEQVWGRAVRCVQRGGVGGEIFKPRRDLRHQPLSESDDILVGSIEIVRRHILPMVMPMSHMKIHRAAQQAERQPLRTRRVSVRRRFLGTTPPPIFFFHGPSRLVEKEGRT